MSAAETDNEEALWTSRATRAGSPDPAEAPLIELTPGSKPYLIKVGTLYVKVLVSASGTDSHEPDPVERRVGSEGGYAAAFDLPVGSDEAAQ